MMDEFARHILKGSNYQGTTNQLKKAGIYRPIAPLHALTLQATSPVQCCRVCRGARRIGAEHHNGLVDFERCPWCGGMGTYDVRKLEGGK